MGCLIIRAALLLVAAAEKKRAGMRKEVWERKFKQCRKSAAQPLSTAAVAGACGGRVAVARNASLTRVPPARRGALVAMADASTFLLRRRGGRFRAGARRCSTRFREAGTRGSASSSNRRAARRRAVGTSTATSPRSCPTSATTWRARAPVAGDGAARQKSPRSFHSRRPPTAQVRGDQGPPDAERRRTAGRRDAREARGQLPEPEPALRRARRQGDHARPPPRDGLLERFRRRRRPNAVRRCADPRRRLAAPVPPQQARRGRAPRGLGGAPAELGGRGHAARGREGESRGLRRRLPRGLWRGRLLFRMSWWRRRRSTATCGRRPRSPTGPGSGTIPASAPRARLEAPRSPQWPAPQVRPTPCSSSSSGSPTRGTGALVHLKGRDDAAGGRRPGTPAGADARRRAAGRAGLRGPRGRARRATDLRLPARGQPPAPSRARVVVRRLRAFRRLANPPPARPTRRSTPPQAHAWTPQLLQDVWRVVGAAAGRLGYSAENWRRPPGGGGAAPAAPVDAAAIFAVDWAASG